MPSSTAACIRVRVERISGRIISTSKDSGFEHLAKRRWYGLTNDDVRCSMPARTLSKRRANIARQGSTSLLAFLEIQRTSSFVRPYQRHLARCSKPLSFDVEI